MLRPLHRHLPRSRPRRRGIGTEEQIKAAELQRTPPTPDQIVTEIPHSTQPSLIYDVPSPLWYHRLSPLKDFFSSFSRLQRRRPLAVAVGTSVTTYFLGDILAQEISGEPYHASRTARMLLIGCIASIPGYKWFMFLGTHFNYGSAWVSIALKVAIQQMVFAPVFNTYFFGMQALLSGETMHGVVHRVKAAVPESIWSSAKFWPAVTAVNFTVVPAHLRFAVSGVFAVVWQTYLSFLNKKKEERHMAEVPVGWTGLAEEAKDRAGERLDEAGITDLVEDVTEKVGDVMEDAKGTVGDVVDDVKEKVSDVLDDAKEKVIDAVQDAKDKVSDAIEDAKDKVSEALGIEKDQGEDENSAGHESSDSEPRRRKGASKSGDDSGVS
jgi:protein Mpv17